MLSNNKIVECVQVQRKSQDGFSASIKKEGQICWPSFHKIDKSSFVTMTYKGETYR